MPKFIATYDLTNTTPNPYTEFIKQAGKLGWSSWILSSKDIWYRLPNTTLIGTFPTRDAASAALKKACDNTSAELGKAVTMEKWIVAEYSGATFDSDVSQPKK